MVLIESTFCFSCLLIVLKESSLCVNWLSFCFNWSLIVLIASVFRPNSSIIVSIESEFCFSCILKILKELSLWFNWLVHCCNWSLIVLTELVFIFNWSLRTLTLSIFWTANFSESSALALVSFNIFSIVFNFLSLFELCWLNNILILSIISLFLSGI